jgi:hypothetical protein
MTCLQLTHFTSGTVPALLTLPHPLTPQALLEVEHAVTQTLNMLRRDLVGAGSGAAAEYAAQRLGAAEIEYASWMPDRGAIEVASWAQHLGVSLREPMTAPR